MNLGHPSLFAAVILSAAKDPLSRRAHPTPEWILRPAQDDGGGCLVCIRFVSARDAETFEFIGSAAKDPLGRRMLRLLRGSFAPLRMTAKRSSKKARTLSHPGLQHKPLGSQPGWNQKAAWIATE